MHHCKKYSLFPMHTHMNMQMNCYCVVFMLIECDVIYSLLFSFALNGILVGSDPLMDSGDDKLHLPSSFQWLLLHTVHCDHYHCPSYCIIELIALTGILRTIFLFNFCSHRYLECASEHLGEGLASHDLLVEPERHEWFLRFNHSHVPCNGLNS